MWRLCQTPSRLLVTSVGAVSGRGDVARLLAPRARAGAAQYGSAPVGDHVRFDFDAGLPDPATFPIDDLVRISEQVLRSEPAAALHYGREDIMYGFDGLREQLAAPAGVAANQVMVTSGGAQAISLACEAVAETGSCVAVEIPTWGYMLREIQLSGMRPIAIPTDDAGMRVDVLTDQVARLKLAGDRLQAVYVVANFSVPTGVCLSLERRHALVALAQRERFVIIEDNTYGALRYDGDELPSLLDIDDAGVVLKIDSFSKILAPGLRLGWVTGHADLVAGMAAVRHDLGVSQWIARIVSRFIDEGLLGPHVERVRNEYRRKRDTADDALRRHCGGRVKWRRPDGGFFYWLEFVGDIDAPAVMRTAAEHGVRCRPGEQFFGEPDDGRRHVRLAFSMYPDVELAMGIKVFGESLPVG